MKHSYTSEYFEPTKHKPNGVWLLYRNIRVPLTNQDDLGAPDDDEYEAQTSDLIGRYPTLRKLMHAIEQDKAKRSSPPWDE